MVHRSWLLRVITVTLLALSCALAIRGQLQFGEQPEATWGTGIAYGLAAMAAFSLTILCADRFLRQSVEPDLPSTILEQVSPTRSWRTEAAIALRRHPRRALALAAGLVLAFGVLVLLQIDPPLSDYTLPFALWLAAIGLYVCAVAGPRRLPRREGRTGWTASGPLMLIVIGLGVLALFLRLYNIGHIPPTLSGDEGSQGVEALRFIRGELRNPFTTSWLSVPTLSFLFNALTIKLLGNTVVALRLPWAIVGASTVLIVFYLVRRLKGTPVAVMTAALLAAYHYHIHFSRIGSNQIADGWFMAALLFFLYRAYDTGHLSDWAFAGVVAGLAQYSYAGARFATVMLFVAAAWFTVRDGRRFWRAQRSGIVIAVGALLITAGPMLQHALRFPNDYNGRLNSVGILQSQWFADAVKDQGGALPILLEQFKHAALAYNAYPDRTAWYGSPQPFFDFPTGVLFMLGLGYAMLRPFQRRHFLMLAWWWGSIILGGMLTDSPPASQRLTTTAAPAVFFVVLALERLEHVMQAVWPSTRLKRALPALGIVAILTLSAFSVRFYFAEYTPLLTYGNYNAVVATGIAYYARDWLGPDWRMYFFGPPRMSIDFGSIRYLDPEVEGRDVPDRLTAPPPIDFAASDKNAAFIFLPERRRELDLVRQTYPNGDGEEIPSPVDGDPNPLFIVYQVRFVR